MKAKTYPSASVFFLRAYNVTRNYSVKRSFVTFIAILFGSIQAVPSQDLHAPTRVIKAKSALEASQRITEYVPKSYHLMGRYFQYGLFKNSEVVVGLLHDRSRILVGRNDGTFIVASANEVTIQNGGVKWTDSNPDSLGSPQFFAENNKLSIKVAIRHPLTDAGYLGCENIPVIIDLSINSHVQSFAVLLKAFDNEMCGPQASFASRYGTFFPSHMYVALTKDRIFLMASGSVISIPIAFDIQKYETCSLIISADKYIGIIKNIKSIKNPETPFSLEGVDITKIESSLENLLIKYQFGGNRHDC